MSDVIIRVQGLGKRYRIRHQQPERYRALRDVIADKVQRIFRPRQRGTKESPSVEDFWALKDVSFEVQRGDVVGIIGRNGAGKSTLLKILSRITEPSEGCAQLDGRIASLLEVGTGFHPELTGRENIFLNGAILGMSRGEIKRKFDEIVTFAEVEKFLDTPVKRYSSGMYVRLAFAVAVHLEMEVLVVDEVLAVGDVEFQKKCLAKIKNLAKGNKRTVLFVSHNMAAIQTLCNQAMLLRSGRVAGKGDVNSQIEAYLGDFSYSPHAGMSTHRRISSSLTLDSIYFTPNPIESGAASNFALQLSSKESAQLREILILLQSSLGIRVAILDLRSTQLDYRLVPDRPLKLRGQIRTLPLVEGDYSVALFLDCGDFSGGVYDLTSISVTTAKAKLEFSPHSPHDRGLLELSYEFSLG
jgi:lipopolysaccharide transport system ATP-binding protein